VSTTIHESALSKAPAATVTDDPAAACASGFKPASATQVTTNGQITAAAVMSTDFAHPATIISGYAMITHFMHIADGLTASAGSTARVVVSATVVAVGVVATAIVVIRVAAPITCVVI
jgi:hypothetical protein